MQTQTHTEGTSGTAANPSFHPTIPFLQTAWDSTSLGALQICPRYYQYTIIDGWAPRYESVHLTFGLLLHSGIETFLRLRAGNVAHEPALQATVLYLLRRTWGTNPETGVTGPWHSGDKNKNRENLIRTLIWYADSFDPDTDPLKTILFANGAPAVELSFRFDSGIRSSLSGENYIFCGHLDRLASLSGEVYVTDVKTTKTTLTLKYFEQFTPNTQISMYSQAGKVAFHQPARGVVIDACQIAAIDLVPGKSTPSPFQRKLISRSNEQIAEWQENMRYWLSEAERYAHNKHWPMNEKSCDRYGGCPFREICSLSPAARPAWLRANYTRRTWNPLQVRGDI